MLTSWSSKQTRTRRNGRKRRLKRFAKTRNGKPLRILISN